MRAEHPYGPADLEAIHLSFQSTLLSNVVVRLGQNLPGKALTRVERPIM